MAFAPGFQTSGGELGGGGRGGVTLQEGQGDVAVEFVEDGLAAGPVGVQQCGELVDGGDFGLDVVGALPGERLQVEGGLVGGLQAGQEVAVGAEVVGEFHAVARVRFGLGGTPARAHRVEEGTVL
ncbi:hypothetical protein OOK40_25915 [Streptomyces sp. NBC_01481]|nr:hypothetical protein [Streptomyces sp. NBC_01481]MCX4586383.1 hypothetical protein [Streptomyces sp. NBC_01481]